MTPLATEEGEALVDDLQDAGHLARRRSPRVARPGPAGPRRAASGRGRSAPGRRPRCRTRSPGRAAPRWTSPAARPGSGPAHRGACGIRTGIDRCIPGAVSRGVAGSCRASRRGGGDRRHHPGDGAVVRVAAGEVRHSWGRHLRQGTEERTAGHMATSGSGWGDCSASGQTLRLPARVVMFGPP